MDVKALAEGFPSGVDVPSELRSLCEFDEANGEILSGLFELETDGRDSALAWFGDDARAADQFAVFGSGPDGSLYALWLYAGLDAVKPPVVLLDSEGEGSRVVAADIREFLRLLAIGYNEPGRFPTLEPDDPDSAAALRDWLESEFGLVPPATAEEIVASAQTQHPDLTAWVREWQERQ